LQIDQITPISFGDERGPLFGEIIGGAIELGGERIVNEIGTIGNRMEHGVLDIMYGCANEVLPIYGPNIEKCANCDTEIFAVWYPSWQHKCNHPYTHCITCCTLSRYVGKTCAVWSQEVQNHIPGFAGTPHEQQSLREYCAEGIALGTFPSNRNKSCDELCIKRFPWPKRLTKKCFENLRNNPHPGLKPLFGCDYTK
jgi:hypothetical protein